MKKAISVLIVLVIIVLCYNISFAEGEELSVGTVITMGEYEQDGEETNGKEPVEWIVLDIQDGKALVLSRNVIDTHLFHNFRAPVTWETSEVRDWLNNTFFDQCFNPAEQQFVVEVSLDNSVDINSPDTTTFVLEDQPNTIDKIFLLSLQEAKHYFPNETMRSAEGSEKVKKLSSEEENGWLLRTTQPKESRVLVMRNGAPISNYVYDQKPSYLSDRIRPAFWLDLTGMSSGIAKTVESEQYLISQGMQNEKNEIDDRIGSVISFGTFEQDNDLTNGSEPIEWIILDIQGDEALLLSRYALDSKKFHNSDSKVSWEESDLRVWLNDEFYSQAFSDVDQSHIVQNTIKNSKGVGNDIFEDQEETEDNVFLLSREDVIEYFPSEESRLCSPTVFAASTVGTSDEIIQWALRTQYDNKDFGHGSVFVVVQSGGIYCANFSVYDLFVRPAVLVRGIL